MPASHRYYRRSCLVGLSGPTMSALDLDRAASHLSGLPLTGRNRIKKQKLAIFGRARLKTPSQPEMTDSELHFSYSPYSGLPKSIEAWRRKQFERQVNRTQDRHRFWGTRWDEYRSVAAMILYWQRIVSGSANWDLDPLNILIRDEEERSAADSVVTLLPPTHQPGADRAD